MEMKRTPTHAERAMLMMARAIDSMGDELQTMHSAVERVERTMQAMSERDAWVDAYRADHPNPFAELGDPTPTTHARARHYIEPDETRQ